jgi:PhnB protein
MARSAPKGARKAPAQRKGAAKAARTSRRAAPVKKAAAKAAKGRSAKRAASRKAAPGKAARTARVEPVPAAYGSISPHLVVSPAMEAIEFYVKAFGAKRGMLMDGPGGMVMHGELKIGDSIVMLADEMPPMGPGPQRHKSPKSAGATTCTIMLYVKNVDAVYARAVAAGATGLMPPADMFWGDRYGQVVDPYGHVWAIATHIKDMTPRQMRAASAEAMASMGPPPGGDAPAPATEG